MHSPQSRNAAPLIELRDVTKVYRTGGQEVRALDGVSLTIRRGEFVAIMGQSGSGKSTLMNILGCLDRPTEGSYTVSGTDVATLSSDDLAALRRDTFGFVFQRYNLLSTMTAAENVELPAIYAGTTRGERFERAKALLTRLGMGDRAAHRPSELSGGQQQRVSIARALMNGADVILADEPTGALDTQSGADVLDVLKALNEDGRTVLLITHDPAVAKHADRTIQISDGRITADSGPKMRASVAASDEGPSRGGAFVIQAEIAEAVKMAFRSLRANIFRTALTLLGVVIGVAAVVVMLAIGDGSKANIMGAMQSMGTNLLVVRPGAPGMRPSGDIATLIPADAEAILEVPNVTAAVAERSKSSTVRFGNVDYRTQIEGTWPEMTVVRDWNVAEGGFFTEADLKGYAPVIVLGRTVVDALFPNGGSAIGKYVLVGNIPFEVVGVMEAKGAAAFGRDQDDVAFVPLTTGFMRLFGQQYANSVTVKVADANRVNETEEAIHALLMSRHRTEDFQIRNTASMLETMETMSNTMTILLGSVAAISLLVGGIGVMNIMLVSVTERTREIGIRMATGARMSNILVQFNTEALVVCGVGGLIGVLLGLSFAWGLASLGLNIAINAMPSILAFSCAFLTGLVFGYLPARKAAQLDPVVALASE
ncbi:MacB family efflux pump subunit [Parvibaculum sp.]|uniref:MacB family efflux pump subunit n=1 Tax=Parvibaculum sp. TaxID=2024848 RepID=UPI001B23024F|nr:MacB family efflux pump subunit [Parvibaculum sp.]MBO6678790.1 MacB family efflux pump subunit [Parvibaculum sp.]MBO6684858.1 MacB family efflux pump subunit [Parvibaculum sp.]MBO6903936.1 MacB family efflux pump subunit [Parvibaculum sp.]